jgi:hypothetical protein
MDLNGVYRQARQPAFKSSDVIIQETLIYNHSTIKRGIGGLLWVGCVYETRERHSDGSIHEGR